LGLGLPLLVSIWFAGHPPVRAPRAELSHAALIRPQRTQGTSAQEHEQSSQPANAKQIAPASSEGNVEPAPARLSAGDAPQAALPTRPTSLVQARQARAPARSRAGTIRWSDL
ncbi:MAG TPA: hypothetical protein VMF89_28620, partial [Polyangiales bacterium]|nr:hypothetical protein [Polyangiales bacterium]